MDKYDPNQWTKSFVLENEDFCMQFLAETNETLIDLVKKGNYAPAIAGLDRIINGLITMQNAGGDFASEICFYSWVEADIVLFGLEAPENKKREVALMQLLDAKDFAKSDSARKRLEQLIYDLQQGMSLSSIKSTHGQGFPSSDIEILVGLKDKFKKVSEPVAKPSVEKKQSVTFCTKCGTPLENGKKQCPKCGWGGTSTSSAPKAMQITSVDQAVMMMKNGDERGFSYIYSNTYKYVYARAKCMFRNERAVRELMQRVYLFVHRNINNYAVGTSINDWLRSVIMIQGTYMLKQQKKEMIFSEEQGSVFKSMLERDAFVEKQQMTEEDAELANFSFEAVLDEQKVALVAYFHDKMSVRTIAELLSVNPGTIYARIYMGKQKLQEDLKDQSIRVGRAIPDLDSASIDKASAYMLKRYATISEAAGKEIFVGICKALDNGGIAAMNKTPNTKKDSEKDGGSSALIVILLVVIIVMLGVVAILMLKPSAQSSSKTPTSDLQEGMDNVMEELEDFEDDFEFELDNLPNQNDAAQQQQTQQQPEEESEYILPYSDVRLLTDSDLRDLTKDELALARNEIYARHGRMFKNDKYQSYFNSKSWYNGTISPEEFDTYHQGVLSEIEKKNIEMIMDYEAMLP